MHLGREVLDGRVGRRIAGEEVEDGRAPETGVGGITSLGDKVFDDVVKGTEVVGIGFAELEEVEGRRGTEGRLQVDLERGKAAVSFHEGAKYHLVASYLRLCRPKKFQRAQTERMRGERELW